VAGDRGIYVGVADMVPAQHMAEALDQPGLLQSREQSEEVFRETQ
jgi:hypothetical protein